MFFDKIKLFLASVLPSQERGRILRQEDSHQCCSRSSSGRSRPHPCSPIFPRREHRRSQPPQSLLPRFGHRIEVRPHQSAVSPSEGVPGILGCSRLQIRPLPLPGRSDAAGQRLHAARPPVSQAVRQHGLSLRSRHRGKQEAIK